VKVLLIVTALNYNGHLWVDYYPMPSQAECQRKAKTIHSNVTTTKVSTVCWNYRGHNEIRKA